jgi:hypothetical protein
LVAVLVLRTLLSSSEPATRWHFASPWMLIVVALVAAVMLREAGRGLVSQLPHPQWSARFVVGWAASSCLLLTVLPASHGALGVGAWISIPVAACLGLVLAASLHGARRLLEMVRLPRRIALRVRAFAVPIPPSLSVAARVPAPLLAGWSDRGPPPHLS